MDSATLPTQLTDTFGRRFEYLRLSITDVCNFKCQYCLPDGYQCETKQEFLSKSEVTTIVSAFAFMGTKKVRITGGEPSLRKDLVDIIRLVANTEGIEQVAITTNGYKLDTQIASWKQAGLTHLNVSVDSLDPHQFAQITGDKRFDNIMRGLEKATQLGLVVKVNAVLLKTFSQQQLKSFLTWIKTRAISLRFIELMQTGDNLQFFNKEHVSGESIKRFLIENDWRVMKKNALAGPAQIFQHADYEGNIGLIMPYSKDFCSDCNRLRISSIGALHLCLFSEQGIDLREVLVHRNPMLLASVLAEKLHDKKLTHALLDGQTGATKHLAMLGG